MLCGVAVVKINQEHLGALIVKAYQLAWEASGVTSGRAAALAVQMQQQCRKALKFSHEVQCKAPSCRCHLPFFPMVLPNPRMEIILMPRWIHGAVPPFLLCPGPCPQECPGGDQAGTQCSREGVLCCQLADNLKSPWVCTETCGGVRSSALTRVFILAELCRESKEQDPLGDACPTCADKAASGASGGIISEAPGAGQLLGKSAFPLPRSKLTMRGLT